MHVRLQKFLADAGIASRRASERFIVDGRVSVNGRVVKELGTRVDASKDRVTVDSQPVQAKKKLYLALNKPVGYLCSRDPEDDRRVIAELVPKEWSNLFSVGRLDVDSEGLIFLTNDGDFCLKLTHPRYGVTKNYIVTVKGHVTKFILEKFAKGMYVDGDQLKIDRSRILSANNSHSIVEVELSEGKNREIRRLFEAAEFEVVRLQRIRIGKIKLAELPVGKWRMLTATEIKSLLSKV
ncbi:MAG: rluB2 [Verrucomicrobiales bacterium]|nr:rluB2 [Verrucomicrobiales bacterium]